MDHGSSCEVITVQRRACQVRRYKGELPFPTAMTTGKLREWLCLPPPSSLSRAPASRLQFGCSLAAACAACCMEQERACPVCLHKLHDLSF